MSHVRAAAQTLLQAASATEPPLPLPVSTASKTKNGALELTFTCAPGTEAVKCRRITVTIPVGSAPESLTSNPASIDYRHSSNIGAALITPSADGATFEITRSGPVKHFTFSGDAYLMLILSSIAVSRVAGSAELDVAAELTTADTPTESDWDVQQIDTTALAKSQPDFFYLRSFSCVEPQIDNPGTAELRWEGSEEGTRYLLSWNGHDPMPVSGQSEIVKGLTDTTTFVLHAQPTDPDTGQPADRHLYLSTTVTVKEPTIHARSLVATNSIAVPGTFTADSDNHTTTAHGPTTLDGDVTIMPDHNLTVGGQITAAGPATVGSLDAGSGAIKTTGPATAGSLDAGSGAIKTTGPATAGSLNTADGAVTADSNGVVLANGKNLTVGGNFEARGTSTFQSDVTIADGKTLTVSGLFRNSTRKYWAQGTWNRDGSGGPTQGNRWVKTAPGDGILVGALEIYDNTSQNDNIGYKGRLTIRVAGKEFWDTAPILRQSGAGCQAYHVSVPVRKADQVEFYLWLDQKSVWGDKFAVELTWFPMGTQTDIFA